MEGKKKAICIGNWGIPAFSKLYIPIKSGIEGLIKDEIYWIPKDYDLTQENSLFKEFKDSKEFKEIKKIKMKEK